MHPVYHAKITVSTKNFPRSEGRKCGVKGLVQWHGLMVWSRSRFWTTKGRERVRVSGILEFTTLDDEILGPFDGLFRRFRRLLAMDIRTQCHGGVHFSWWGLLAGGVFSPWIYGQRE